MNIDEASKMKPPKHSGVKWKKSGDEWFGTFKTKNLEYDLIWSDDDPDSINYDNGYSSGNDSVKGFFKNTIKQEEKDYKEMYESTDDIKDRLTQLAITRVEELSDESKPDFNEIGLDEVKIIKKHHAKGGATKHKKASNSSQILSLTGKSKKVRRVQGIKLKKTLRKRGAGKQARINKKRQKAMNKKGTTFKRAG